MKRFFALFITVIFAASICSAAEFRKWGVEDLYLQSDNVASQTTTSTGGVTSTHIGGNSLSWDNSYSRTIRPGDIITKGPWVDVRAHGAKGDNVTDDTAAIQAAINSLPSDRGGTVFFPRGYYRISKLDITNRLGISFVGAGNAWETEINFTTNTDNVFDLTGSQWITFKNLKIAPATGVTKTAGSIFLLSGGGFYDVFEDLLIVSGYTGFYMKDSVSGVTLNRVRFSDTAVPWHNCIQTYGYVSSIHILDSSVYSLSASTGAFLYIQADGTGLGADSLWVMDSWAQANSNTSIRGIVVEAGYYLNFTRFSIEGGNASTINGIDISGGSDMVFTDIHSSTNDNGIRITGGKGITLNGGRYWYNKKNNVVIAGGTNINIQNAYLGDAGTSADNTYDGVRVEAGVTDFKIQNNSFMTTRGSASPTLRYGVYVADGASARYSITGNNFSNYGYPKAIYDGGTGYDKNISGNINALTEESLSISGSGTTSGASADNTDLWTQALADGSAYYITAEVIGRSTSGVGRYAYTRKVLVYRDSGGAATITGSIDNTTTIEATSTPDCTFVISGNNVILRVTGEGSNAIKWVANVRMISRISNL